MEDISDKKRAIFESTLELIKEHGFHGAPMSLVAKDAGVAAGTIYHYFKSKDELICELNTYNKSRMTEIIKEVLAKEISYKEKYFKIWRDVFNFYVQNSNVLIFFEQFVNSPYNTNKCPNHFQGKFFDFFKEGVENGEIKEIRPEFLMVLTMGSISSVAKIHKFANIPLKEQEITPIIEVLWNGITLK